MIRSRTTKTLAIVAALALPLAACSDSEDDAEDAPETTAAPATTAAPDTSAPADDMSDDTAGDMADDSAPDAEAQTIVDIAASNPDFSTLVTAVTEAGLAETLSGGEWTVFAPTNAAFDALPEGTLDGLLADPEGALTDVLTYHVVEGKVMASDVVGLDGQEVATVNGATLLVGVDGETVTIGDATVVTTDIEASNGVIHVIDTVLVAAG